MGQWLALPDNTALKTLRHVWVLMRHDRPKVPTFIRCPMPKHSSQDKERNAMLIHAYFHPFTLRSECASEHVPLIKHLRRPGTMWEEALEAWFDGRVLSSLSQRYIQNFLNVTQVRPDNPRTQGASDNDFSDEELKGKDCSLQDLLHTEVGGSKDDIEEEHDTESSLGKQKDAFTLCKRVWEVYKCN